MAHPKRFELLTPRFVVWCSIQLSYGCVCQRCFPLAWRSSKGCRKGLQAIFPGLMSFYLRKYIKPLFLKDYYSRPRAVVLQRDGTVGNFDAELRARAGLFDKRDRAAMRQHKLACDNQPQPRAA